MNFHKVVLDGSPDVKLQAIAACKFYFDETSPIIDQTVGKIPLKFHQLAAIYQMRLLENTTFTVGKYKIKHNIGILRLNVGSGKSFMILEHVFSTNPTINNLVTYSGNGLSISTTRDVVDINILIVPHNIYLNWINYLNVFVNEGTYESIGSVKNIQTLYFAQKLPKTTERTDLYKLNFDLLKPTTRILLIKSTMLKFLGIDGHISRLIVDEADSITISSNFFISAEFTWLISGTFQVCGKNIYHTWLRTVINNANALFHPLTVNKNKDSITSCCLPCILSDPEISKLAFNIPDIITHSYFYLKPIYIFEKFFTETQADMLKQGAYAELADSLGINIYTFTDVINAIKTKLSDQLIKAKQENRSVAIESISTQIESLEQKINENTCPICMEIPESSFLLTCCTQLICTICLFKSIKEYFTCPICRADIKQTFDAYKNKNNNVNLDLFVPTIQKLINELINKPNIRLLLCSPYISVFSNWLDSASETAIFHNFNISWTVLNGNSNVIASKIKKFQEGTIKILCLNTLYACAGMNLQFATDVIMSDHLTTEDQNQFIGRAQRPGRTEPLNVHFIKMAPN